MSASPTDRLKYEKVDRLPDGRRAHYFRQSWIEAYFKCPELLRRKDAGEVDDPSGGEAAMGTAVHAAIEESLRSILADEGPAPEWIMEEVFERTLLAHVEEFPETKFNKRSLRSALVMGRNAIGAFNELILPTLTPRAVEINFGPLVFHEDSERVIYVTGTSDYLDWETGPKDWKTASEAYAKWEKERWNVQSTLYGWALWQMGLLPEDTEEYEFEFVVFLPKGKVQRLPIVRTRQHWRWLKRQVVALAQQVEADLKVWPLNDQGWWCSEKWCPAWHDCKGAFLQVA